MFGKDVEVIRSPDAADQKMPLPRGRAFRPIVWKQFNVSYWLFVKTWTLTAFPLSVGVL